MRTCFVVAIFCFAFGVAPSFELPSSNKKAQRAGGSRQWKYPDDRVPISTLLRNSMYPPRDKKGKKVDESDVYNARLKWQKEYERMLRKPRLGDDD
ncbi:hypothetical protein F5148DRAFT_1284567 [Russula earlei]|uniref:Uncharacterized protein n=1 Tax=Russula earlei TaxID=71964 RepID=A0ACC0U8V0_9AGAM|nr:hypothetical protein F5148DRAFT_1284567 [Russula earlei]